MIVRHVASQADPTLASAKQKSWLYRTEVENDGDHPIRVVWFEFYYLDSCHGDGTWFGTNIRNRPLRNPDFVEWYNDAKIMDDGWLQPGDVAACDPNYSFAFGDEISPVKWSFVAVDSQDNDYFAEATVPSEAASLYDPKDA
jgi:hypothetical protein